MNNGYKQHHVSGETNHLQYDTTWTHNQDTCQNDSATNRSQIDTTWTHLKTVSRTKLPNGRLSLLVDLGSRINIIGCNTEREFALEGERHGHKTTYESRKHRLNVNGVGEGSAPCDEEANIPIAVQFQDNLCPLISRI